MMATRNQKVGDAIDLLRQAGKATEDLLGSLMKSSVRVGRGDSSTLFGTAGGLVGLLIAMGIAHLTAASLLAISAPLTALGTVGSILFYRGRRRIRVEKRIEEHRLVCDEILQSIAALPKNAPAHIRDKLWDQYSRLTDGYSLQATVALEAPTPHQLLHSGPTNPPGSEAIGQPVAVVARKTSS